jgi:hypothetical protein
MVNRQTGEPSPAREGYIYEKAPGGGYIGYSADARPGINWKHIDGPLLYGRNGRMHWLTWRERFRCWMGWEDAMSLEAKHWPPLGHSYCQEPRDRCEGYGWS